MKKEKKLKNNLDERQEQMLLQVEQRGCWLAFWGLLISLTVQFVMGMEFSYMAGEWIIFMVLAVYIGGACAGRGIWDRRLKPDAKTNLMFSAICSLIFGVITFAAVYHRVPDKIVGSAAAGVFAAGFLFVLTFLLLSTAAKAVIARQKALDAEPEMESDSDMDFENQARH